MHIWSNVSGPSVPAWNSTPDHLNYKEKTGCQACGLVPGIMAPVLTISWFLFNASNFGPPVHEEKISPFILPSLNGELIVFPELMVIDHGMEDQSFLV